MIFFHATTKENVFSIMRDGLKTGYDGHSYFCKTVEECLMFFKINPLFAGRQIAVIPIDLDENTVKESSDHNKAFIPADAFCVDYDIPADKIPKNLDKIRLFKIEGKGK